MLADPDGFPEDCPERPSRPQFASVCGMVKYSDRHLQYMSTIFPEKDIAKPLGEVIADHGLNQLRTANGPLVDIDALEERECTQDDRFRTSCTQVDASDKFVTQPGYNTHGTVSSTGVCAGDDTITCSEADVADPAHPCSSADPDTDGGAGRARLQSPGRRRRGAAGS